MTTPFIVWQLLGMWSIAAAGSVASIRRAKRHPIFRRHDWLCQYAGSAFATREFSSRLFAHRNLRSHRALARCHPRRTNHASDVHHCNNKLRWRSKCSSSLYSQSDDTEINECNWQSFSKELDERLELPSISVPAQHVHSLLSDRHSPIKPYLATCMVELEGVHPKIKLVKENGCNGEDKTQHDDSKKPQRRKRILLDSRLVSGGTAKAIDEFEGSSQNALLELTQQFPGLPDHILKQLVEEYDATCGGPEFIDIPYQNQPITRILSKVLPPDAQPPPSSYEQIGHVAHVNLRKPHLPHGKLIGRVMLDRLQSSIRTVVNKLGEDHGGQKSEARGRRGQNEGGQSKSRCCEG